MCAVCVCVCVCVCACVRVYEMEKKREREREKEVCEALQGNGFVNLKFSCLSQVDYVIFDKTGTLTHGQPRVVNVVSCQDNSSAVSDDALAVIGTAESGSEHPLGQAVVRYVTEVRKKSTLHGNLF